MKSAIVTGASSGIGQSISEKLVKNNIKVYGISRHPERHHFCKDLYVPVTCDLMNIPSLCEAVKQIQRKDEISILINNAGVGYFGLHEQLNPKKIHEMVAVNLEAPLILTQLLLRDLKKNDGFVINLSSVTAKKSNPHGCAYGATKAGLSSFSSSLFDEARKYGVKVVTVHPDMTKSNFYEKSDFEQGETPDSFLFPEEIADAVWTILQQRDGLVVTDITIQPQKHKISRKKHG